MLRITAAVAALLAASPALAVTEVQWWHAMGGELGAKLEQITADFNASQTEFKVTPSYKGTYPETMTAAIAAFRAGQQPAIVQVFEVGTGTMMAAKGAIKPVHQLMKDAGEPFDPAGFLPAVVGYYTDAEGNMLSMPFNSSTPVMYYNKTAFEKAGIAEAPTTWAELAGLGEKLAAAGMGKCVFTSQWISWIQTENLSAWHNQPIGTEDNGFGGTKARLNVNGPVQVKHWENLKAWADAGAFKYGGPAGADNAAPMFYSQECPIFFGSSAARAGVMTNAKDFEVGTAMLPHYDDVEGAPQNSIIGGATLWVMEGRPAEEYKAVARFFTYLSSPEVQAAWSQGTGYLPITQAAYDLGKTQGFFEKNPGTEVALQQITLNAPTANSKGLRFGNYVQIRGIIDEEFEQMLSGSTTAEQALGSVVERGNALLTEFEAQNP